jgi:DmsE family decaheme c-type cytochrome
MNRNLRRSVLVAAAALFAATLAGAADQPKLPAMPCADCHDTLAAAFASNPHARALGRQTDLSLVCESCHAGGPEHVDQGGDPSLISIPKGAAGPKTCLSCHGGKGLNDIEAKSVHTVAGVYCTDCHSIHGAPPLRHALLREGGSTLCVSCHPDIRSAFLEPNTHHMDVTVNGGSSGGMQCYSCHNPHGQRSTYSLKEDADGGLVCLSCHTDKRGPFVFSHVVGVAGNCLSCHEPHGSVNSDLLIRSTVDSLCLECHTTLPAGLLGSQPPSFHDLTTARYRNCTTCHVAVHGSNSSPTLLR